MVIPLSKKRVPMSTHVLHLCLVACSVVESARERHDSDIVGLDSVN